MIGSMVNPPPPPPRARSLRRRRVLLGVDAPVEAVGGHLVHAEGLVELPQQVVGREIAVLELLAVRADLGVDERAHRVTNHHQLFGPLEHRTLPVRRRHRRGRRGGGPGGRLPRSVRTSRASRGSGGRRDGRCIWRTEQGTDAGGSEWKRAASVWRDRWRSTPRSLRDVLIRLRRDVAGGVARWTLGGHGVAEIDVDFFPTVAPAGDERPAWSSTAAPLGSRWHRDAPGSGRDPRRPVDTCELTLPRDSAGPVVDEPDPARCSISPTRRSTSSARSCSGTPRATAWPRDSDFR